MLTNNYSNHAKCKCSIYESAMVFKMSVVEEAHLDYKPKLQI